MLSGVLTPQPGPRSLTSPGRPAGGPAGRAQSQALWTLVSTVPPDPQPLSPPSQGRLGASRRKSRPSPLPPAGSGAGDCPSRTVGLSISTPSPAPILTGPRPPSAGRDPSQWDQRMRAGEAAWGCQGAGEREGGEVSRSCVRAGDPESAGF